MAEDELSPLDKLMLAATAAYNEENTTQDEDKNLHPKSKPVTHTNEDEYFLSKIAAHDLKVLKSPPAAKKVVKKSNEPNQTNTPVTPASTKNNKLSIIHTGDTDSSDDESNRDYQNSKYNDYGREIKHLLPEPKSTTEFTGMTTTWKQKREAPKQNTFSQLKPATETNKEEILNDPFFGIRISKPLISSAVLQERMNGRTAVTMSRVKNFVASIAQAQDWVIAGAIVQKSNVRTSQNGAQYIIWTISDLKDDLKSVSLFLFRNAYKELWKTATGTVIGVLNPAIMDNREGSKHEATLSVDNHQRVMIFGQSKDFGFCKSKKKDGEPCTAFVNLSRCTYCLYHVRQEYQKCSVRSELQSKFSGGGLTALRNKVLGKNEVFYAGKSYMAIPAKKSKKLLEKDNKRLTELSKSGFVTSAPVLKQRKGLASTLDVSRAQRKKDLDLIRKLNGTSDILSGLESKSEFDSSAVSSGISLDESRQAALDVIAKLKSKSKPNSDDSSPQRKKSDDDDDATLIESSTSKIEDSSIKLSTPNKVKPKLTNEKASCSKTPDNKTNLTKEILINTVPKLSDPGDIILFDGPSSSKTDLSSKKKNPVLETTPKLNDTAPTTPKTPKRVVSIKKQVPNLESNQVNKKDKSDIGILNDLLINKPVKESDTTLISSKTKDQSNEFDIESLVDVSKLKMFKNLKKDPAPTLSSTSNSMIDLSVPLHQVDKAKLKALTWVQRNGPINKENPTGTKKTGVKRFLENSENSQTKKSKLDEKIEFSDRFKKIMALTSKHADLLEQHDLSEQEKYFNKLEMREKMEEKMMSTYKMNCKAVKCLNCKYTNFSAAERCKQEKHVLKVFDAVKRFFKCGNCGNRTVALEICPLFSCKQCGGSKWERTTMMKERKVHVGEALSIRGGEQTFLASVQTNANINLLVPED